MLSSEHVHCVLHRVSRQDFAVVALCMDGVKVTLELNIHGNIFYIVLLSRSGNPQQAYSRLAVTICNQIEAHRLAASISRISIWTQQQWDMVMLGSIVDVKDDGHFGKERLAGRREIIPGFKGKAIFSCT